ncbi:MAG: gliding motility-associated C-terminal domain-containing protein [Candidatus Pedobacter colombiensis]|uniref:Gliding motility-associated C-terminal domain-containing protein n=1 Tax=Candidatus Pedobacter colombiensis TaxID=3121371 RepID=A0AAJ5W6Q8_9SPHI|nr:gliding motility-associated C-terminal domain-containing protein [Pedobacter sp.]WEK18145.1 MAG: gliding motility-associated C-terminal domain-containing protein [Pedobacter sp.]
MKQLIASIAIGFLLLICPDLKAQLKIGSEGLFIQTGTVFYTEGLTLVPSNDWGMNNLMISKQEQTVIWPKFNSIQRLYRFSRAAAFSGELALNYEDIELNGNEGKNLVLAYSKITSNNYKDYTLVKESVANPAERYVGQLFTDKITLSDLTAVTMESLGKEAYSDLIANNMITPNGDGVNDTWVVKNIHLYPNNELKIYDREGRLVFNMIGYDNSWGGLFNGNPLPEDSYYYVLYFDSGKFRRSGFISIVRE